MTSIKEGASKTTTKSPASSPSMADQAIWGKKEGDPCDPVKAANSTDPKDKCKQTLKCDPVKKVCNR